MRPLEAFHLIVLSGIACCSALPAISGEVEATPTMAERLIDRKFDVVAGFRRMIETKGTAGNENLTALANTDSPAWGLYYRDRQLLFSVPVRRNVIGLQRTNGQIEARDLAVSMLQQQFSQLLALDESSELKPESVRVVFVEPDAHAALSGQPPFSGLVGPPLPFAASGYWPTAGSFQGACGCR